MSNNHPSNLNVNAGADGGPWQQGLLLLLASTVGGFLYNRKAQEAEKLRKETEELKQEKERFLSALLTVQGEGEKFQHDAEVLLKDVEQKLMKRQAVYCNPEASLFERYVIERDILDTVKQNAVGRQLKMQGDLIDLFLWDSYCTNLLNSAEKKIGKLMWDYLGSWKEQVKRKKENMLKDTLASHNNRDV